MTDPAFLFYPGDYLRDTQNLSEKAQVAYDRIMCEHMRNICINKQQLKFFTKRLSELEIEELKMVLTEVKGGYIIDWVAKSISKRKAYNESRRKNRSSKIKKDMNNISKTYVEHMENENENENIIEEEEGRGCLLKNSKVKISDIQEAFINSTDFKKADPVYYYESALDWSSSKNEMRVDWIATIRNFARRDLKEGKLVKVKKTEETHFDRQDKLLKERWRQEDEVQSVGTIISKTTRSK